MEWPPYSLALKHKLVTITNYREDLQFYDENGHANFSEALTRSEEAYGTLITGASTSSVTPIRWCSSLTAPNRQPESRLDSSF
ncbi:hypothetical protein FRC04_007047 [Tulasnella sp. 424]|nr:hypothetical protein FRC04_007047 [Tulasnella sp. 424]